MNGRVALVTGAASGIGAATARRLADEGVGGLVVTDRDGDGLATVSGELAREGLEVLELAFDVADADAWAGAEATVRDRFGGVDCVVANAGIGAGGRLAETSFEEWRRVLRVNLDGVFLTLRAGLRLVRDGGTMVVVASAAALKPEPGIGAYAASKAGAAQLGRVAAKEAAERGVRVNVICPGGVETAIWDGTPMFQELSAKIGRQGAFDRFAAMATPLKRFQTAEEIAGQIAFLLSDASGAMTGSLLVSDGGYTL